MPLRPRGWCVVDVEVEAFKPDTVVMLSVVTTGLFASLSSVLSFGADMAVVVDLSPLAAVVTFAVVTSATNGNVVSGVGDVDDEIGVALVEEIFPVCTSMLLYLGQPATTRLRKAVAVRSRLRSLADFLKMHFSGGLQLNKAQSTVPLSCTLTVATLQSSLLQQRSTHSCSFPDLVGSIRLTLAPEAFEAVSSSAWPVCHTPGGSHWLSALMARATGQECVSSRTVAATRTRRCTELGDAASCSMLF